MHLAEGKVQPTSSAPSRRAVVVDRDGRHHRLWRRGAGDPLGKLIATGTIFLRLIMMALPIGIIRRRSPSRSTAAISIVTWGMIARAAVRRARCRRDRRHHAAVARPAGGSRRGDRARGRAGAFDVFHRRGRGRGGAEKENIRLGVGQFFGEVAVLRRARRSALAVAHSPPPACWCSTPGTCTR